MTWTLWRAGVGRGGVGWGHARLRGRAQHMCVRTKGGHAHGTRTRTSRVRVGGATHSYSHGEAHTKSRTDSSIHIVRPGTQAYTKNSRQYQIRRGGESTAHSAQPLPPSAGDLLGQTRRWRGMDGWQAQKLAQRHEGLNKRMQSRARAAAHGNAPLALQPFKHRILLVHATEGWGVQYCMNGRFRHIIAGGHDVFSS